MIKFLDFQIETRTRTLTRSVREGTQTSYLSEFIVCPSDASEPLTFASIREAKVYAYLNSEVGYADQQELEDMEDQIKVLDKEKNLLEKRLARLLQLVNRRVEKL